MQTSTSEAEWGLLRKKLLALAYRLLGDRAEAEDIVHDVLEKWLRAPSPDVRVPDAYLYRAVTNRCTDRFRLLQAQRAESYIGPWLPEPIVNEPDIEISPETGDPLSLGVMYLLERLKPNERAAFVLRESFGQSYDTIAETLDTTPANARQLFSRAHKVLESNGVRYRITPEAHQQVLLAFITAFNEGKPENLVTLLRTDAQLVSDGGGKAIAARKIIYGAQPILQFLWGLFTKFGSGQTFQPTVVNGLPGIAICGAGGVIETVFTFEIDNQHQINTLMAVRNPEKLIRVKLG